MVLCHWENMFAQRIPTRVSVAGTAVIAGQEQSFFILIVLIFCPLIYMCNKASIFVFLYLLLKNLTLVCFFFPLFFWNVSLGQVSHLLSFTFLSPTKINMTVANAKSGSGKLLWGVGWGWDGVSLSTISNQLIAAVWCVKPFFMVDCPEIFVWVCLLLLVKVHVYINMKFRNCISFFFFNTLQLVICKNHEAKFCRLWAALIYQPLCSFFLSELSLHSQS